jgi:hypothetical protein
MRNSYKSWLESLKGRHNFEGPGVDGGNIKTDLRDSGEGTGWIKLAQDRDRWRALVNMVMKLRVQ